MEDIAQNELQRTLHKMVNELQFAIRLAENAEHFELADKLREAIAGAQRLLSET